MKGRLGLALLVVFGACRSEPGAPFDPGVPESPPADLAAGREAFASFCAGCHASRDGFDLAFFDFPDSTIVRRAVLHVDSATARNIADHVRNLGAARSTRGARLFQPGGVVLAGDVEFATALFGSDAWPADMTTAQLLAIDPLVVPVAVPFPRWSVEFDNLDWMPDAPLVPAILDHAAGAPRRALERYYAAPTLENLLLAVAALRGADRDPLDPGAPCARLGEDGPLADEAACFQMRRWAATLAAQHMLRVGAAGPEPVRVHPLLHDAWWDVGNAARLATRFGGEVDNGTANWASWMLLGWVFEPGRHASVYTGNGLLQRGLPRHATFVALRSLVARPHGGETPYADASNAARFAPTPWAYAATRFAFDHLLERLGSGDRPEGMDLVEAARVEVERAYAAAAVRVGPAERAELARRRDAILAALP